MRTLFSRETARQRHRDWHWCRHWNGFLDNPLFRVVAARLHMPLYQVQAFVSRLEELANMAEPRGYVGHFRADLFAVSLGMDVEDAARIFAELEHPEIGWIDQEHLATFYDRNRDREDMSAAARKHRQRLRERIRKKAAELARRGAMAPAERGEIERSLMLIADEDLERLNVRLADDIAGLSTGVSRRDTVTVTPEKSTALKGVTGDNFGTSGAEAPQAVRADSSRSVEQVTPAWAQDWLSTDGVRLVVERSECIVDVARMRIARWRKAMADDPEALRDVLTGVGRTGFRAERFLSLIDDEIARRKHLAHGPPLPLGPAIATSRREGKG